MPGSTSNFGWTYPISSDDLNAGASTIGSLATSIDAALAVTNTNIANKVRESGVSKNISVGVYAVTTDANGRFLWPNGDGGAAVAMPFSSSGAYSINTSVTNHIYGYCYFTGAPYNGPVANTTIYFTMVNWG